MKVLHEVLKGSESFKWIPSQTPLASDRSVVISCASYLAVIGFLSYVIRSPIQLPRFIPACHNVILCLGSLIMFVGTGWEVYKGGLYYWSYIFYLSKYYELLDTLLIVLKKKPLSFLHVFHHTTVLPMAYFWLADKQSLQQIALLTNTLIHVLMYSYYFLCTLGWGPNWKRLITNAQIVQFVFSFMVSIPFWWQHATGKSCSGFKAMVFNAVFNLLLLMLFINFHKKTYARKTKNV